MKSVYINGTESEVKGDEMPNMADFVELVKTVIDPDHMITSILLDGRELEESEWSASTSQFSTSIIEIETGKPSEYVAKRMENAAVIVEACAEGFQNARASFQEGTMQEGNTQLVEAVNTLQAFFQWYGTMIQLVPENERQSYTINAPVDEISEVCRKICQQQLYQSWWALGETLEQELDPKLTALIDFLAKWSTNQEAVAG